MTNLKIVRPEYDAWLQVSLSDICNMDCHYCISEHWEGYQKKSGQAVATIDIPKFLNVLSATKKTFKIVFTGGGEPFVIPNIIEACLEICKSHYLAFNTNLTSPKIKEFNDKISPHRVMSIQASLHLKELERTRLFNRYIENFLMLQSKGFKIEAKAVAHPSIVNDLPRYQTFLCQQGIKMTFGTFIGNYEGKTYPRDYTQKEIQTFDLNASTFNIFNPKGKLCNAGFNAATVKPNGDVHVCMAIPQKIGNIYEDIGFLENVMTCPQHECPCPYYAYDQYLFKKALRKDISSIKNIIPYFTALWSRIN